MKLLKILALGTLAGLALVAAACSGSSDVTNTKNLGRVQMTMTAAPAVAGASVSGAGPAGLASGSASGSVATNPLHESDPSPGFKSAKATLTSILARNVDGQLVEVMMDLPTIVDLMALGTSSTVTLPVGLLPPGDYDQFVVVIKSLEIVTQNDTTITIEPPGGGWTAIVKATPFSVVAEQTTDVTLKFRKWSSFGWMNGKIDFHPEFECEVHD